MLEVNRLSRSYDDFVAVNNVSFNIGSGEIVGLLGHNGAGKTTIMKMLSGYLEPNAGTITFEGQQLAEHTKTLQARLGYLPENLPMYPDMVVADYLDFAAGLKGLGDENRIGEIRRVVAATELGDKLLAPIRNLSRGFKQRLGVAQAILGRPRLLILDEPTNGLDPTQTAHMRDLIRTLAADATVILSTHIMQEVEAVCTRVLMLRAGELAVDSTLEDLHRRGDIVLTTSLDPERLATQPALAGLHPRTDVTPPPGSFAYRLTLESPVDSHQSVARLARAIHEAGGELHEIYRERRDLEALFREVNSPEHAGVVNHAA